MGFLDKEDFDPSKRHYQLDTDKSGNVICTKCKKVLEERTTSLSSTDMMFGQYRYIRENLPCAAQATPAPETTKENQ